MSEEAWKDFDHFINYYVPKQTIPRLRQFAAVIERHSRIRLALKSQERKADLVNKLQAAFQTMKSNNQLPIYQATRAECEQIGAGQFSHNSQVLPPPTFGTVPASNSAARLHNALNAPVNGAREYLLVDWKRSPMWKPLKALTGMETLPDIMSNESSHTRRERRVVFSLPNDVIEALNKSKSDPRSRPLHSVRLFCASNDSYRQPGMAGPPGQPIPSNRQVPIEYPSNPDVLVDGHTVPFKERGLRGKPGSAPPLDLDKSSRGLVRMAGRMASVSMGHTGPTASKKKEYSKKFYFQVVYCEVTTMEDLLGRLESLTPTDPEVELARLRQQAAEDDDIQVGTSSLSLKDPLSGMRITKPVRSRKCSHLQCFDAKWWLESNKSHPQWLCPHCSKELDFEDVICDGYFLSILRAVPDSFDEVTLEPSGEWHTQNNQYGSTDWLAEHGAAPPITANTIKRARSSSMNGVNTTQGKRRAIEILSDSDDDEDSETPATSVANGHSNGYASTNPNSCGVSHSMRSTASAQPPAIIDLTLSSDEDTDDEDQLHFRPPGGGSTSRAGGGSSGARPASETRGYPMWSPKRLVTTSATSTGPPSTSAPAEPGITLRLNPPSAPSVPAPSVYATPSNIRGLAHPPPFHGEGLTSAQIFQAADHFGPRASSSRSHDNASASGGLTAAQILAAADHYRSWAPSSSTPPPPPGDSPTGSMQPQPRIASSYRPPPRSSNGYSHYS